MLFAAQCATAARILFPNSAGAIFVDSVWSPGASRSTEPSSTSTWITLPGRPLATEVELRRLDLIGVKWVRLVSARGHQHEFPLWRVI